MSEAAFDTILKELKNIKKSNSEIRIELKAANEKILKDFNDFKVTHDQQMKDLHTVLSKIKEENLELKRVNHQLIKKTCNLETEVSHLSEELNKLKQEKLSDQFVIPGIPYVEGEDLRSLIVNIGDRLKIDLRKNDFTVTRLKSNKKPITTLLVRSSMKKIIFEKRKINVILLEQLGFGSTSVTSCKEVYFYHQLTKMNHDLLNTAKTELKKTNLVKFVWFQNNQVLVRQTSTSAFSGQSE